MICTIGDLLLDVVVHLHGPIVEDADTYGRVHVGGGGQAANVAAWVVELGGAARVVGKRAADTAGRLVADELHGRGVELAGPEEANGTGAVVSIATRDGRRAMLSDRGVSPELREPELDPAWFAGCEWLHVAGYSLTRSPLREAALAAARYAREAGARVSLDVSSTSAARAAGLETFGAACQLSVRRSCWPRRTSAKSRETWTSRRGS